MRGDQHHHHQECSYYKLRDVLGEWKDQLRMLQATVASQQAQLQQILVQPVHAITLHNIYAGPLVKPRYYTPTAEIALPAGKWIVEVSFHVKFDMEEVRFIASPYERPQLVQAARKCVVYYRVGIGAEKLFDASSGTVIGELAVLRNKAPSFVFERYSVEIPRTQPLFVEFVSDANSPTTYLNVILTATKLD